MNTRNVLLIVRFAFVITLLAQLLACSLKPSSISPTAGPNLQATINSLNTQVASQATDLATQKSISISTLEQQTSTPASSLPSATETPVLPSIIQPQLIATGGEHIRFHIDQYIEHFNIYWQIPPECSLSTGITVDKPPTHGLSVGSGKSAWVTSDRMFFEPLLTVGDHIVQVENCATLKWEMWTIGTPPFEIVADKEWDWFSYDFLINDDADYLVSVKLMSGSFHLTINCAPNAFSWDVYASEEHTITPGQGLCELLVGNNGIRSE